MPCEVESVYKVATDGLLMARIVAMQVRNFMKMANEHSLDAIAFFSRGDMYRGCWEMANAKAMAENGIQGIVDWWATLDPSSFSQAPANYATLVKDGSGFSPMIDHIDEKYCEIPALFLMKDGAHQFLMGLYTIFDCLKMAEQKGYIPIVPDGWWMDIENRFAISLHNIIHCLDISQLVVEEKHKVTLFKMTTGQSTIFPLTTKDFERETGKSAPWFQHTSDDKISKFAVCPLCDNPIKICDLHEVIGTDYSGPYGLHVLSSVRGIAKFQPERLANCWFRKEEN